ncbi:probable endo-beta-1,4-glucanase D [Aspergillus lentulus]|uniref:AA9 family lytic polysaccharide monooxygenase n=1 Tax=Aspergillus lentulus TaxID=293939 RepID=A0AAN4PC22_ASPLE|nr:probable endo-beta-1,4-glucanase D [Aspergillus lentulus]GAQ03201.1 probable endo-beta-1,4-glucanase D [Aspergillus lentulus]GFF24004.1 probable endo-beta-1,4-glucanase D [Aspergillus lentulus]GFF71277.1 probable endo-beta-1,4-glucanase D [Aspergillus lentulus]GFF89733.1 probable endo-beta-1,4-glucanase D [Aspergillus lentulus]
MKFTSSILFSLASITPLVSGHYVFSKLIVDGKPTQDFEYIRKNTNGYMPTLASDILSNDFRCNQGSMQSAASTKVYTVAPGTELGFKLAYGAQMKHPGPLQIYMSKAPGDVKSYDGSGDWFKVHQEGLCADTSKGIVDEDWCTWGKDTASFKIPEDLPAGQYLVRVEHIGLHRGFSGNSEFYFTCAQIEVTGSGSGSPSPVVKIPGVYKPDDTNIHFNIYYPTPTAYNLPGPSVWTGGSAGAARATAPAVNNNAVSAAPTTMTTVSKSSARPTAGAGAGAGCGSSASSSAGAPGGALKKYAQCGGLNWTGSGSCETGTTCHQYNPYYHQCV